MKELEIYKVNIEKIEDSFILEYNINDKFESKRYYFLSFKYSFINRIKNIDDFIEYCELNNIAIIKMNFSEEQSNFIFKSIENLILKNRNKKIKETVLNNNQYFYNSLDKSFNDYDYTINTETLLRNRLLYKKNDKVLNMDRLIPDSNKLFYKNSDTILNNKKISSEK